MKQLGLPDIAYPTLILNNNQGSIDWIESSCKPTKKSHYKNLSELGIAEAHKHGEVDIYWIPGNTNVADIFTKEDNDVQHFESLCDLMVTPRETFGINFTNHTPDTTNNWVHRACSNQSIDHQWRGVLKRGSDNQNLKNLINQTRSKGN